MEKEEEKEEDEGEEVEEAEEELGRKISNYFCRSEALFEEKHERRYVHAFYI